MSVIVWTNKPSSVEPVSEAGLSPSPRPVFPQFVTQVQCEMDIFAQTACTEGGKTNYKFSNLFECTGLSIQLIKTIKCRPEVTCLLKYGVIKCMIQ